MKEVIVYSPAQHSVLIISSMADARGSLTLWVAL